jgi:hypothetical protein
MWYLWLALGFLAGSLYGTLETRRLMRRRR